MATAWVDPRFEVSRNHLREVLGEERFDGCVAAGAAEVGAQSIDMMIDRQTLGEILDESADQLRSLKRALQV